MTITLSGKTQELLEKQAIIMGESADNIADDLLSVALEAKNRDFEESCAAIAETLDDDSGDISLEDIIAQERARPRPKHAAA